MDSASTDPFPLCINGTEYRNAFLVQSDDDSDLAQEFRYISRFTPYTPSNLKWVMSLPLINLLHVAAIIGDIQFLYSMEKKFGGIFYVWSYVTSALDNGHLDFYMYYIELSKGTCIIEDIIGDPDPVPNWALCRYQPLRELMAYQNISEVNLYMLVRYIYENVILSYPPHEYMLRYAWALENEQQLVSSWPNYPNLTEREEYCILDATLCRDEKFSRIRQYLVEEKGFRFEELHVRLVCFRKRLYEFVLRHLKPELDPDLIRSEYPLRPIDDFKLLSAICFSFKKYLNCISDLEIELKDMAELLFNKPNLIPKIVHIIKFLECNSFQSESELVNNFVDEIGRDARSYSKDPNVYAREMSKYLRQVLDLMSRLNYEGFNNVVWTIESPIDFANFEYSFLR